MKNSKKYKWKVILRKEMWWPCDKEGKIFWESKKEYSVFAVLFQKSGALAVVSVTKSKGFTDLNRLINFRDLPFHPENVK